MAPKGRRLGLIAALASVLKGIGQEALIGLTVRTRAHGVKKVLLGNVHGDQGVIITQREAVHRVARGALLEIVPVVILKGHGVGRRELLAQIAPVRHLVVTVTFQSVRVRRAVRGALLEIALAGTLTDREMTGIKLVRSLSTKSHALTIKTARRKVVLRVSVLSVIRNRLATRNLAIKSSVIKNRLGIKSLVTGLPAIVMIVDRRNHTSATKSAPRTLKRGSMCKMAHADLLLLKRSRS
jgi:hypothetical protein